MSKSWPGQYRAAAAFTFDVDAESTVLATDPGNSSRMSLMSHQAYGPKVGVPRLLQLLERREIQSTFFVPGFTADTYPDTVRRIIDGGHEVAHHGYLHEPMQGISAQTEAGYLDRGLDALEKLGVRPVGFRAPWWELNWHTPDLLIERGFEYDSSLFDDDIPYRLSGDQQKGDLVEIPIDWALDDWEQYAFYPAWTGSGVIESPDKVHELWLREVQAHHANGSCFVLTNHPFISGRPSKAAALEQLIEEVTAMDDIWVTTLGEIARHTAATVTEVRTLARIEAPADHAVDRGHGTGH
jgi:peptidoglycan/xylan/chitin deacetylase (PgdA/CDA1 family)